ncbi:hypothetical protein [Streptomyces sp. KL116D]|uniref:hypothetical protein n=1 Tax=Streptomyces sp. KL116D TaxID=3045152 RepID=UPI003556AE81
MTPPRRAPRRTPARADARRQLRAQGAGLALSIAADGSPVAGRATRSLLLVAVPPDIEALRKSDPALGLSWRIALRETLLGLLEDGAIGHRIRPRRLVRTRKEARVMKLSGVELLRVQMPLVAPFRPRSVPSTHGPAAGPGGDTGR